MIQLRIEMKGGITNEEMVSIVDLNKIIRENNNDNNNNIKL